MRGGPRTAGGGGRRTRVPQPSPRGAAPPAGPQPTSQSRLTFPRARCSESAKPVDSSLETSRLTTSTHIISPGLLFNDFLNKYFIHFEREEQWWLVASRTPPAGQQPATQACALTGNPTSGLSVRRRARKPGSHTSWGSAGCSSGLLGELPATFLQSVLNTAARVSQKPSEFGSLVCPKPFRGFQCHVHDAPPLAPLPRCSPPGLLHSSLTGLFLKPSRPNPSSRPSHALPPRQEGCLPQICQVSGHSDLPPPLCSV